MIFGITDNDEHKWCTEALDNKNHQYVVVYGSVLSLQDGLSYGTIPICCEHEVGGKSTDPFIQKHINAIRLLKLMCKGEKDAVGN